MRFSCQKCAEEITIRNIDLSRLLAKCGRCDNVFSIADYFEKPPGVVPYPKELKVVSANESIRLSWRWISWHVAPELVFALFWNYMFLLPILRTLFASGSIPPGVLMLPTFWVGIVFGYKVLTELLNKTSVTVSVKALHVKVRPFPYPWNRSNKFVAKNFVQFYVKEESIWPHHKTHPRQQQLFALYGIDIENSTVQIMRGMRSAEIALYIESQLETFFGIVDIPVRGEIPRAVAR